MCGTFCFLLHYTCVWQSSALRSDSGLYLCGRGDALPSAFVATVSLLEGALRKGLARMITVRCCKPALSHSQKRLGRLIDPAIVH